MKYNAPQYARALLSLVEEAPDRKEREVMRSFFRTLTSHGALSLVPEIVRAASDLRRREKNLRKVAVRTEVRENEETIRRKLHFKAEVQAIKDVRVRGGAVVESEGLRVDNSIAMRLKRLQEALCA